MGAGAALDGVAAVCPPDVGGRVPAAAGVGVPPVPFAPTVGVAVPGVAVPGVAVPEVVVPALSPLGRALGWISDGNSALTAPGMALLVVG